MTYEEFERCLESGAAVVDGIHADTRCNIISFGEMGSGNTSSSAVWMSLFADIPIDECVGAGAGLNNAADTPQARCSPQRHRQLS